MADAWLQSNVSGPWSTSVQALSYNMGVRFQVSSTKVATALRWQRVHVGSPAPQNLTLYSTDSGGTQLAVVAATDSGALGWQESSIAGVTLVSGKTYIVSAQFPASFVMGYIGSGIPTATHDNLTILNPARAYVQSSSVAYPNNTDNAWQVAVDAYLTDSGAAPTPGVVSFSDMMAAFTAWFSSTANDFHTGLPWLTKGVVDAIKTTTDAIPATITALQTDVTTALTRTAGLAGGTVQSALTATESALSTGISAVGTGVTAVGTGVSAIGTVVHDVLALLAGGPQGMAPSDDPGWTEVDSGAFSGTFTVSERCDRIYVHITTVGSATNTRTIESWDFGSFPWWWVPLFANMAGSYQPQMAREAVLYVPGVRMEGALVVLPADFEGTYSAARYDGA